jgi:multidrug resistance efflux pump
MADTMQLEVTDKPKLPEVGDKSTQPQVADKPKQPGVSDKPTPTEQTNKPKPAEQTDKSKPAEETDKTESADASGKDSKKKVIKILVYVGIGVVALALVKYFFFTPPEAGVVQVRQQDYVGEVQSTGTVNVDVLAAIGAKIPGRIEHVLVNEGDFVRSGQVVVTLEDTDIRQVLDRSEARLQEARMTEQAARATEQSARAGARSAQAVAQARGATKYQMERAWEREKHLVATGAVSQEEADQYEERDRTAASAVQAAEAEIGAAQAQIEAAGAKAQAVHSEIAAADAEVRLQQFNLSQTKIFTYVNGVVTDRPKRAGDAIVSGETVLTVADPKVTLVEAYLDQRFAGDIKAGQAATVILRGRANQQIAGRVYRVRPQADPAAEEMTVEIAFPLPPAELQIGQWADAYVQVSQTKNALVVPKSAVTTMGDGRYVLVMDAKNRTRRVDVQSLASSPRSQVMAVVGDLKPGDWVLTQPMGIKPGKKVRPTQDKSATGPTGSNPAMKM